MCRLQTFSQPLQDLRVLAHMPSLQQLTLEDLPMLSENALQSAHSLRQLEYVRLVNVGLTAHAHVHLRNLPPYRLRCLELCNNNSELQQTHDANTHVCYVSPLIFPLLRPFTALVTLRLVGVRCTLAQLRALPTHVRELHGVEVSG